MTIVNRYENLVSEMNTTLTRGNKNVRNILMYEGYSAHQGDSAAIAKGYAFASLFRNHKKIVYENDLIAGSLRGYVLLTPEMEAKADAANIGAACFDLGDYGSWSSHFAPDYEGFLRDGVSGILRKIRMSRAKFAADPNSSGLMSKIEFLDSMEIAMTAFSDMIGQYGQEALQLSETVNDEKCALNLRGMSDVCQRVKTEPPATFREALQLVWLTYVAFLYGGHYAMAFGRMDQYLYPFYSADIESGTIDANDALTLLKCTFVKIMEHFVLLGYDDVVNIAIGGVKRDGTDAVNELSYIILEAVKQCNIPGPNLSARISSLTPDRFLDECLISIGTGLGYPALMNDEVNVAALARYGYAMEDCRDYCMVGCIENFLPGMQPPWSDGRYNTPKYIELALNNGKCMLTGAQLGPQTGEPESFENMDRFIEAVEKQMARGVADFIADYRKASQRYADIEYVQPFLSCLCKECIETGLDIWNGGAVYPSVFGVACMGIGTFADSLTAVQQVVFEDKSISMGTLRKALIANFEGCEGLRARLMKAPKYGNGDDRADHWAVWFVENTTRLFDQYRTVDGGAFYTGMAANISNISAGKKVAATPDGRKAGRPLSDAASPTYAMDKNGPTAAVLSVSKPDYTIVGLGSVVNQKYTPEMFSNPEKRAKLLKLIRVYFSKGGQEMQINAVGRKTLQDALENPERYQDLVVRVSGYSARYTSLPKEVQEDILNRTEHA